jgi:hypothetical protein
VHAIVEERQVAAKLVDGEAAKQRSLVCVQEADGADDRREHAAAFDIGDEHPGRLNAGRQPEVHEVVIAKIQLADAARALDDDDVEAA